MRQSILFLVLLLHSCTSEITTNLATTFCDALKVKCDALPYRTVYIESNCYFIIDAMADTAGTTNKCTRALPGAQLARRAPDEVWQWLFVDKNDFLFAGAEVSNKKKAMCIYENSSPCIPDLTISRLPEGTCSVRSGKKEEPFIARMITEKTGQISPVIVALSEKLEPGQTIIFNAIAKPGRNDFLINFESSAKNIQLQIGIVFSTKQVWLSSFLNNKAGKAEIVPHQLQIDRNFEIVVRTRAEHFKICIDGKDFAEYKYRQPLASITQFRATGYGYLNSYQLGEKKTPFPSVTGAADSFPICNKTDSKKKCKSLVVSGILATEYKRVSINLVRRNDDIAIHFNPRYDVEPGFLLFDTQTNNRWLVKQEIMYKPYPKQGEHIEVEFVNEETGFQVFVNGQFTYFLKHRMPSFDIVGVETSSIREPVITFRDAKEQKFTARMITEKTGQYSPVIVELPEKLKTGQEITVNAIAKPGRNEFEIHLLSADRKDIVFIVYIQFSQRQIQLNTFFQNRWGAAEIKPHNLFIDQDFDVSIQALDDHFKVRIDGKDFAEYKYRQPLSSITHLMVKGYGYVNSYKLGDKYKTFPTVSAPSDIFPVCSKADSKKQCKSLVVSGILATEYQRVSINLVRRNDDIAIHFNPRYDVKPGFLLFDTQTNNQWWVRQETMYKLYPKQGEHIEVEFVNEETGFQIFVNGQFTYFFKHRMPSFDIVGVETSSIREPVITFK